jgi:sterol desaturase/sphingolipid hydroxylase (fatty acid hydroxylase superfamily)
MAPGLVTFIVLLCGALVLLEFWIPLFASKDRASGRRPANLGLTLVTFSLNWLLDSSAAILALFFSIHGTGLLRSVPISRPAWIAISILVLDLSAYWAHRSLHKSPLLWRIHRVHHTDSFVDVTTAFRQHPLEGIWRFLWTILPVWMLGLPAAGAIVYRFFSAGNALFEHANIRLSERLDRTLARLVVSPNMHKVHHSRTQRQTDSNYGNILAIFDRVFHTFRPSKEALLVSYGLDDISPEVGKSISRLVMLPFGKF